MPGWGLYDRTLDFEDVWPGCGASVVLADPRGITQADRAIMMSALQMGMDQDALGQPILRVQNISLEGSVRSACRVAAKLLKSWRMWDRDGNELPPVDTLTVDRRADYLYDGIPEPIAEKILSYIREEAAKGVTPV